MEVQPKAIAIYQTREGRMSYREWVGHLKDKQTQVILRKRIDRLSLGLMGDVKALGDGVFELRIDYGPGFRVYYAMAGQTLVLLLLGGDKSTQSADITKAKEYWHDWQQR